MTCEHISRSTARRCILPGDGSHFGRVLSELRYLLTDKHKRFGLLQTWGEMIVRIDGIGSKPDRGWQPTRRCRNQTRIAELNSG